MVVPVGSGSFTEAAEEAEKLGLKIPISDKK